MGEEDRKGFCIACKEPIMVGATKCIHCNAGQTWKNHLNFSSTILALLVALLTVLSTAIPILINAFNPKDAVLKFELQTREKPSDRMKLKLIGFNSGPKPGIVKSICVESIGSNKTTIPYLFDNAVILPSKVREFRIRSQFPFNLESLGGIQLSELDDPGEKEEFNNKILSWNNEVNEFLDPKNEYSYQVKITYLNSSLRECDFVLPISISLLPKYDAGAYDHPPGPPEP